MTPSSSSRIATATCKAASNLSKLRSPGARQIGFTIVSISLSLVAAFIPLLFMGGVLGKILQEFGWTLAFAILISAAISLTITPMICGRFMHRLPKRRETWVDRRIEPVLEAMDRAYARSLDWALGHRWLMLAATFIVFALSVMTFIVLPKGLIPSGDSTLVFGFTRAFARRVLRENS